MKQGELGAQREQEAKEAINTLLKHSNFISPGYSLGEVMDELVKNEHRTIQQTFIKELYDFLVRYSDSLYDQRNEESVKFANKVKEMDVHFPFI